MWAVLARPTTARAAPGFSAAAELQAGGGYDTNLLLSTSPDATGHLLRLGGWFGQLAPGVELAHAGSGYRWALSYGGDYRGTSAAGHLYYQELGLSLSPPALGPLRFEPGLVVGRFDALRFPGDRFMFAGAQTAARLALSESLRVVTSYRFDLRSLDVVAAGGAGSDRLHLVDLRISYRPASRLEVAPRATYVHVSPAEAGVDSFRRLRAGLEANLVWERFTVLGGAWAGPLSASGRTSLYGGGRLEARRELWSSLELYAAGDWTASLGRDAPDEHARRSFAAGMVVHATTRPALPPAAPRTELRPLVRQGRVRFRLRAERATSVTVVGSWNDWAEPGGRLRETREPGLWEVWLEVGPGAHRYRFIVDGIATRPPDAPRYVADGFGGQDGVVEVGAAGGS